MLVRRPPFPGMDPWLEAPARWPNFHNSLVGAIRDDLAARLAPRYFVGIEEHAYTWTAGELALFGLPDAQIAAADSPARSRRRSGEGDGIAVAADPELRVRELAAPRSIDVNEAYLKVVDVERRKVVTILEVLSPSNKQHPRGRIKYFQKRDRILDSTTSLVEIDLLRAGTPFIAAESGPPNDYRIVVRRGRTPDRLTLFEFSYKTAVPSIPIPLKEPDADVTLELNKVLHAMTDRARFFLVVPYERPADPPLRPDDDAWAAAIVAQAADARGA